MVAVATMMVLLLSGEIFAQGGAWTAKAPMPTPRCCTAAEVIHGVLYVVGGGNLSLPGFQIAALEAYNPKTNTWTSRAPMPAPRSYFAAAVVDGILYAVGGQNASFGYLATVEAYDPKTDAWSTKAPMPTPRVALATAVIDGRLYAVGGEDSTGFVGTLEVYDPQTNTWSSKAPMPTPRRLLAAGVVDGRLYAVGGDNLPDQDLGTVEVYDPKTDTWTTKASMPTRRTGLSGGVIEGLFYVAGGHDRSNVLEAYNPKTDTWSSESPMPTPRGLTAAGVIDDTLYVVGGYSIFFGANVDPFLAVNEAFSPFLTVTIDIKPGDPTNVINLKSAGMLAVAILSSESFDATTVDPASVTFAGAAVAQRGFGKLMVSVAHVDADGRLDLLLHFRTRDLELAPTDTEAVLRGTTFSGQRIRGADSIHVVPSFGGNARPARAQAPRKR